MGCPYQPMIVSRAVNQNNAFNGLTVVLPPVSPHHPTSATALCRDLGTCPPGPTHAAVPAEPRAMSESTKNLAGRPQYEDGGAWCL